MHPTGRVKQGETNIRRLLHPKNRGKARSMHPAKWKKPCGARLFGQRKNANLCIKISVLLWRSGWDSNPRTRKGQQISSLPRYDRFDTTPYISSAALPGKSERTTGENRLFNSSLCSPQSLAASGFSRSRVPRRIHDFESAPL